MSRALERGEGEIGARSDTEGPAAQNKIPCSLM